MSGTEQPPIGQDPVQPPLMVSLVETGLERGSSWLGRTIRSADDRLMHVLWFGGGIALAVLVLAASVMQSPGLIGVLKGLGAGVFLGLLYLVGFGWLYVGYRRGDKVTVPPQEVAAELQSQLAATLKGLDALRAEISAQVRTRSVTRIPLGVAAAVVFWVIRQRSNDPPGIIGLILFVFVGALAGEQWASYSLARRYRRRYKDEILPQLAASIGTLTYREASSERLRQLGADRILPAHDSIEADDEISGTHAGLPIEIIEVKLKRRINKKTRVVFDGLLVGLTLPRSLTGTTVIATDRGAWSNFKAQWTEGAMEPVRLEHDEFEKRYEVRSTDQVEARALLTPAFMERFVEVAAASHDAVPGAIASGNHLVVALPKRMGMGNLFEPPPYWKSAGGQALVNLQADIRRVLRFADSVIELDFWARGRAADARRQA